MLKTLLFDVDGVLVIGEHWHKDLERTHGITSDLLAPFFRGPFQACLVGKADLKVELANVLPRIGWLYSVDAFVDYWFRQDALTLNDPLLQTIQLIRQSGIKCYLATQQERYRTNYILREMGFSALFDGMFSSVDTGYMKNDPRFFASILTTLDDCPAENILFWDDTPVNVDTARSAGMVAEIYTGFADFQTKTRSFLDGLFPA